MFGVTSRANKTRGKSLRKPWTIATTCDAFHMLAVPCDGSHDHAKVQGCDTQATEGYTDPLADAIHEAWKRQCGQLR